MKSLRRCLLLLCLPLLLGAGDTGLGSGRARTAMKAISLAAYSGEADGSYHKLKIHNENPFGSYRFISASRSRPWTPVYGSGSMAALVGNPQLCGFLSSSLTWLQRRADM